MNRYRGPLRDQPLAVELHNTLYAGQGEIIDGLVDPTSVTAWLHALGDRLPATGAGREPDKGELIVLRQAVRDALHATVADRAPSRATIDTLNQASAQAPRSPTAHWRRSRAPEPDVRFHSTRRADIVISAIAADAIDLITGPSRHHLRACGAPGCVLLFLKQHPRREWCSAACGNRARQARHYRRTHNQGTEAMS
jgi:predicted RNA-binding Zn ribbon-like protein